MIHVQNLLLLLPSIRNADLMMKQFWNNVQKEGKIKLSKLLIEMLESKNEPEIFNSSEK